MTVSEDTLIAAAATLAAAMIRADIDADRLHLDSEGSPVAVMSRFDTALEELRERFPGDDDDLDESIRPRRPVSKATIDLFGPEDE